MTAVGSAAPHRGRRRSPCDAIRPRSRVVVVGSINVDLVTRVARLPAAGETVGGGVFEQHQGGKGANQAVAARRLGADVEFIGVVGQDAFGESAAAALIEEGVHSGELGRVDDGPTGVALILVDAWGENVIAVAPGANATLMAAEVTAAMTRLAVGPDDIVLVSHEIPTAAARAALLAARRSGARSILNPAPATGLDRGTFGLADLVTPNRSELATIAIEEARRIGRTSPAGDTPEHQARALLETNAEGEGPRLALVVTLGAAGALLVAREGRGIGTLLVPAMPVRVVDSTGAGDAFNGALAAGLVSGSSLDASVRRAVAAAGLATTTSGAREGMPTTAELEAALAEPSG
jgi:ribokinase